MKLNVIPKPNDVVFYGGEYWLDECEKVYITDEKMAEQAYALKISNGKITITSKGEWGKFYAEKTLEQMCEAGKLPCCRIADTPAFPYRGFMIDSARHMQTVDEIKTYIEAAARYKFNVFHWHLCDDQGWRIESEKYPELCTKGAYRDCHGFGSDNMERYGGYYTKEQIRDVIDFCKERYIDVIPEIDMPGHTTAIVSTYPELSCKGEQIPLETTGGIFRNILCAGKEEVFDFCFGILDEVCELFPSEYIHIGGDEAPKDRWKECECCQNRIKSENLSNEEQLQGYFANRIIDYLSKKGKKVLAWNETLNSGLTDNVIICDWMDKLHKSETFANAGGKIIIEDFYHYYLDYPYGMTPLKKTYEYDPYLERLTAIGKMGVLGVETPIWTEYVEDFERLCYMCFPRMIAVAETGWTKKGNAEYKDFKLRVINQRQKLLQMGITMADESEWDPKFYVRMKDTINRFKKNITPTAIRDTLKLYTGEQ